MRHELHKQHCRWPVPDDPRKARRLLRAWRQLDGQIVTTLPGEGGLLP